MRANVICYAHLYGISGLRKGDEHPAFLYDAFTCTLLLCAMFQVSHIECVTHGEAQEFVEDDQAHN